MQALHSLGLPGQAGRVGRGMVCGVSEGLGDYQVHGRAERNSRGRPRNLLGCRLVPSDGAAAYYVCRYADACNGVGHLCLCAVHHGRIPPKCRDYMESIGQESFVVRADRFAASEVWDRVCMVSGNRESYSLNLRRKVLEMQEYQRSEARKLAAQVQLPDGRFVPAHAQ